MSTSTRRSPRRVVTGLIATVSLALASFGFATSAATADTGDVCDKCSLSFDPFACSEKGGQPYDSTEQNPDGSPLFPDPEPTQSPKPKPSPTPKPTQSTAPKPKPSPTATAKPTAAPKPKPSSGTSTGSGSSGTTTPSGSTSKPGGSTGTTSGGNSTNDTGTSTTDGTVDDVITDGEDVTEEDITVDDELDTEELDGPTIVAIEGDLVPGTEVIVRGEGFPADAAELRVEIHSFPQVLGLVDVNADGSFALTAIVPEDLEPGWHELVVFADDVEITRTSVEIAAPSETDDVEVTAASSDNGGSSAAGLALLGGLVVAGGGAVAFHTLRKRKGQAAA